MRRRLLLVTDGVRPNAYVYIAGGRYLIHFESCDTTNTESTLYQHAVMNVT